MNKKYKHLNAKDKRRFVFYEKIGNFIKKGFKWSIITVSIIFIFSIGLIAFYTSLDKNNDNQVKESFSTIKKSTKNNDLDDTQNLTELEKKELERESKKDNIISNSIKLDNEHNNDNTVESKFYNFHDWNASNPYEVMVVNSANPIDKNLKVKTKICRGKEVSEVACDDLENMILDAKKDGIILWISSGYRNIDLQTRLFNRQVEREKSKAIISQEEAEKLAARVVARPYTSEHNTGLAIDFNGVEDNFYTTKEYQWLMENAHKYGFIERYQERHKQCTGVIYEPWHFRYVGKELAPLIKESGLCLEEYIEKNVVN